MWIRSRNLTDLGNSSKRDTNQSTHPSIDLPLPAGHLGLDMVLHHAGQGGLVGDAADPAGQLRVPDGGVAAD